MNCTTVRGLMAMLCLVCIAFTLSACGSPTDGRSPEAVGRYSPASSPRASSAPAAIAEPQAGRGSVPARVHVDLPVSRPPAYPIDSPRASSAPAAIAEPQAGRGSVPARVRVDLPASRLPAYTTESRQGMQSRPAR
jgi:hypothetical protein